jgi:3'-phosphoadenosine 5'-phosphosulfate (PAPS) 3'-phosphatase
MSWYRNDDPGIEEKGVQDVVSEADRACEKLIVGELSRRFPADGFLGEEGGLTKPAAIHLGDRPDRRHGELRPRHSVLVRFDRPRRRRQGRSSA